MKLAIKTTADDVGPALNKIAASLIGNAAELHRTAAEEFMTVTFSTFGASGINRPVYWPDLSPRYQRAIRYFGRPKLILTGDLSTSINILSLDSAGAEVGTQVEYAEKQQYGSGYLPARPFFPVYGRSDPELTDYARERIETRLLHDLIRFGLG